MAEIAWLLDLVRAEQGESRARRRASAARRRFASGLTPDDRRSYLARDHRARLGLGRVSERGRKPAAQDDEARKRLDALVLVDRGSSPFQALRAVLEAAGAARGAVLLDAEPRVAAAHGLGALGKKGLEELRALALRAGSGRSGAGVCAEIRLPGKPRLGVIYVEGSERDADPGLGAFLRTAAQLLAGLLSAGPLPGRALSDSTGPSGATGADTRSLSPVHFEVTESPRMKELLDLVQRTRESLLPILDTIHAKHGRRT
jgi:hypothetical protein